MSSFTIFTGIVSTTLTCYLAGLTLSWFFDQRLGGIPKLTEEELLEKQLRIEVQDKISQLILDVVERGETPTLAYIIKHCPQNLRGYEAREVWTQESRKMLKSINQ